MLPELALCGCITDVLMEKLGDVLHHSEVDLMEWRLDVFFRRYGLNGTLDALKILSTVHRNPVLATNRPKIEGGMFQGTEDLRLEILHRAIDAGVEWVDVEAQVANSTLHGLLSRNVRVLLSHHDVSATPDRSSLKKLATSMAGRGPHGIKIVTRARKPEDNLKVLELIPFGRHELGVDVIAFCMGPLGRWSRVACLFLGSPWTYVQIPDFSPAAEGQFMAAEMRLLLNRLTSVA